MEKVLIIAYDFPPYFSVGGLRPYSWYKYFHEFDLHPIIVTRQWGTKYGNHLDYVAAGDSNKVIVEENKYGTIIRTPYKPNLANRILLKYGDTKFSFIRKLVTGFFEMSQFIFFNGTKSGLYRGAKKYLKNNKVDAIIATGSPHVLFKYASKLSKQHNIPWIADYRDPWSQSQSRNKNGKLKAWNMFFERKFLKTVSFSTVASTFVQGKVSTLIKDKEFLTILNGYDPTAAKNASEVQTNKDQLNIAFIGTIYKWHPIDSVLSTFSQIIDDDPSFNFCIKFFGINNQKSIEELISKEYLNIKDKVSFLPKTKNDKLLPLLAENHLMLLFNDYSLIGTKIYDYLAIKRNILLCYSEETVSDLSKLPYHNDEIETISNHVQEDLIKETNSGIVLKDKNDLKNQLKAFYKEFLETGDIICKSRNIDLYSRRAQAGILCKEITELLNKTNE